MKRPTGRYESSSVAGETVQAFIPDALPPIPPLELGPLEQELLEAAGRNLGNLADKEMHGILMATGRGSGKQPGEYRSPQNWIGGTRPGNAHFVPPPPGRVDECMSDLERFIHDEPQRTPPLLKSALTHLQFETIHPFLDGNGRIGRLLITLILYWEGALPEPILYHSLYFKQNRQEYYELLDGVRSEGDWESWVRFFLRGVSETSAQANQAAQRIRDLFEKDEERIIRLDRIAGSATQIHRALRRRPILSIREASEVSGLAFQTAMDMLEQLVSMDITEEITGRQRGRRYVYREYLSILAEGTEPL